MCVYVVATVEFEPAKAPPNAPKPLKARCSKWPKKPYVTLHPKGIKPATTYNEGAPMVLGVRVRVKTAGTIGAFRFYKTANETTPTHVGKIYTWPQGHLVGSTRPFTSCKGAGWMSARLQKPVKVVPTQQLVIVLDGVRHYGKTDNYYSTPKSNGHLVAEGGVYGFVVGHAPTQEDQRTSNYFIDCKCH